MPIKETTPDYKQRFEAELHRIEREYKQNIRAFWIIVLTFVILGALFARACPANAVSISIETDALVYYPGDLIRVDISGDAEGALARWAFGRLVWDDSLTLYSTTWRTTPDGWWLRPGYCEQDGMVDVWDHGGPSYYEGAPTAPDAPFLTTIWLRAAAPGQLTFSFDPRFPNDAYSDFFGEELATYQASAQIVPEPGAGSLLGLGLAGLGAARRKRARP